MKKKHTDNRNAKKIIRELWKRANLNYKLHKNQLKLKEYLEEFKGSIATILCSRQFGKTHLLMSLAIETCLRKKGAIVFYVCPSLKQGTQNIENVLRNLLADCPEELMPDFIERKDRLVFKNGSFIQIAGTDNKNHETLRGRTADMCIVDEAGFANELGYVVRSVLRATVLHTRGKIYLVSTPSRLSSHPFIQEFVIPAQTAGTLPIFTVHDNPRLQIEDIELLKSEYVGGEENPEFQREYLCKIIQDKTAVVVPEFDVEMEAKTVKEVERPVYFDAYVSGDVGFKDLTVYLFGYWDFTKARLVIEDELVMNGPELTTDNLAVNIRRKEYDLYDGQEPYQRIMDNEPIMINDLYRLHNLAFFPTAKDDKESAINQVRMLIHGERIIIHPRCKHLIYHLKNAIWDKNHKKFERIPDTQDFSVRGGHADALDSLIYLVRNIDRTHNPFPSGWNELNEDYIQQSRFKKNNDNLDWIKQMINIKKKGR